MIFFLVISFFFLRRKMFPPGVRPIFCRSEGIFTYIFEHFNDIFHSERSGYDTKITIQIQCCSLMDITLWKTYNF